MSAGNVFFMFTALVALVGALTVVVARSPIRSAMGLLATILGVAGLYLLLSAQFLAAIQLIVYAGAVVVLFVFVIMVLGPDPGSGERSQKTQVARGTSAALSVAVLAAGLFALAGTVEPAEFGRARLEHGSVEALGGLIFSRGLVPFELVTVLLIVAIVGAIALVRRQAVRGEPTAPEANPTRRLFGGAIERGEDGSPLPKEPAS